MMFIRVRESGRLKIAQQFIAGLLEAVIKAESVKGTTEHKVLTGNIQPSASRTANHMRPRSHR